MIKLLKRVSRLKGFKAAPLKESILNLDNPGRGWFKLYSFPVEEGIKPEKKFELSSNENLVLILADIGAYRDREDIGDALRIIENIIDFFYAHGKSIILRIAYDHEGKGMEREPSSFKQVLSHTEQIASFVSDQREKIFIYQGLLIGRWGEMHTSKFTDPSRIRELNSVFDDKLKRYTYRAVRRPVQWRMIMVQPETDEGFRTDNLGIFNDGMFGSESDLGTYDSSNKNDLSWGKAWNRADEIKFIGKLACDVPIGGEAIYGEGFASSNNPARYISELAAVRATYLNGYYDSKLIDYWKNTVFNGKGIWAKSSYYDYIGAHLGYRFVIREAEVTKNTADEIRISLNIENCGFANIYAETRLFLEIEGSGSYAFSESLNSCYAGEKKIFSLDVPKNAGEMYIYALQDKEKKVFFANEPMTADGRVLIGELKD